MPIRGIDVSGTHQGEIDWQAVAASGIQFAYIKATQGRAFRDSRYARNREGAKAAGVLSGPYHFYEWAVDPIAQAVHFMATMGTLQPGDLPPAVDFEQPGDGAGPFVDSIPVAINKMKAFINYVEVKTGRLCVVYTYPYAWRKLLADTTHFSTNPLWIADYTPPPGPYPGGWTTHAVWQTGTQGRVPGISTVVDTDEFNGDLEALRAFAGLPTQRSRYFPETGHTVGGGFLSYWEQNGGLATFGYPLTEECAGNIWPFHLLPELGGYTVQLFERRIFRYRDGEDVSDDVRTGALVSELMKDAAVNRP